MNEKEISKLKLVTEKMILDKLNFRVKESYLANTWNILESEMRKKFNEQTKDI